MTAVGTAGVRWRGCLKGVSVDGGATLARVAVAGVPVKQVGCLLAELVEVVGPGGDVAVVAGEVAAEVGGLGAAGEAPQSTCAFRKLSGRSV